MQKGLRRQNPAPKSRVPKGQVVTDVDNDLGDGEEALIDLGEDKKDPHQALRRHATSIDTHAHETNGRPEDLRRHSSTTYLSDREGGQKKPKPQIRDHLKHLGPSNLASRPRQTRYNTVKIKPGSGTLGDAMSKASDNSDTTPRNSVAAQGGVGAGLLNSAGKDAKDGVLAVAAGYGSIPSGASPPTPNKSRRGLATLAENSHREREEESPSGHRKGSKPRSRANSDSTLGSMHSGTKSPQRNKRGTARSGSITEQIVDAGGFKKTVLEMTSSSDSGEGGAQVQADDGRSEAVDDGRKENNQPGDSSKKKKRRRKTRKGGGSGNSEDTPLLGSNGH